MRKLIVPLVVIALLGGAEFVASRAENRIPEPLTWDTQFSQDKATQLERWDQGLEVVITGSSVAQANIDPVLLSSLTSYSTGYNAGLPSMTPRVWRQFLLDTVYPDHCPDLLIIAVDIRQFSDSKPGSDGQLHRYLNSRGRLDYIGEDDFWRSSEEWLESNSALFRIRARLREPDRFVAWVWDIGEIGDWRYTNLTPEGRYQSNDDRTYEWSEESLERLRDGAFVDLSFGGKEAEGLRGIIDDARQSGTIVVLVETPTMRDHLSRALPRGSDDQEWFTAVLDEVATEYGVPLLRFPEMDNQAVYFSDYYHMNWTGVEKLTTLLAEEINTLGEGVGVCR